MIYGILVVYSEDYFADALVEFNKILRLTSSQYKLIVVFNNILLSNKVNTFQINHIDFETVIGTNQFHEFSGWMDGLSFLKEKYKTQYKQSGYIFANDTFCKHRTYTIFHRLLFSFCSSLAVVSRKPKIAGEILKICVEIDFNGMRFDSFIPTYFFSLNQSAMRLFEFNLLPNENLVNGYLTGGDDEKYFFSEKMPAVLKKHMTYMLFEGGWHNRGDLNEKNVNLIYSKAKCFLAEFNLSANVYSNQIDIIDTYYLIKILNKIRNKVPLIHSSILLILKKLK